MQPDCTLPENERVLCIIVDGADHSRHATPNLPGANASFKNKHRFETHVFAAIAHGIGTFVYHIDARFGKGPNVLMWVIYRTLRQIIASSLGQKLPRKLVIQLDNCASQNKNNKMFIFIALLVRWGLFDEITLNFLMVGHTHEDIDQLFGCLADWLRENEAATPEDLRRAWQSCYTDAWGRKPVCEIVKVMAGLAWWVDGLSKDDISGTSVVMW